MLLSGRDEDVLRDLHRAIESALKMQQRIRGLGIPWERVEEFAKAEREKAMAESHKGIWERCKTWTEAQQAEWEACVAAAHREREDRHG